MDELLAWALFPLIALAVCTGLGLLAERAAGTRVQAATIPALGFAAAIVILGPLFATGSDGSVGAALVALLAGAGFVLGDRARLRPRLGAVAGAAAYALHLAPVALTGTATFLGYNLLNDTAIHLALVDWIGDHGSRYISEPASSYSAAVRDYVGTHYPLGSHELLAALEPLTGLDPAQLYQPFLALSAGLAAAAIFGLLRAGADRGRSAAAGRAGPRAAAAIAFAALASQLVFSFALQGSIKELAFVVCLAAAAGLVRSPVLLAVPAAALYSIYGVAALAWIVPLALLALLLVRPAMRHALAGVGVFIVAIAVYVPGSVDYYNHGRDTLTSGGELGPLAGPLKVIQVAGVWLGGDYRFSPSHSWITYVLALAVLALALAGLLAAVRRRSIPLLLFAGPSLVAFAVTAPVSSPYIDAKLLAILSPPVIVAAGAAIAAIPRRPLALAAAAALTVALLVSDALAYRMALPAPTPRLDELARIDDRFAGQGPILVNEFEEYVKHYMRASRGSDPYESWTAGRAQLRDAKLPVAAHRYDLDQMKTSFVERWPLIALRRSPAESRPPSNYDRVFSGRFYEVWKRVGAAPERHVPLGKPPLDPTSPLDCALVKRLSRSGTVVAAMRPQPATIPVSGVRPLPAGWYVYGQDGRMLEIHKGGALSFPAAQVPGFSGTAGVHYWMRGRTTRTSDLRVGERDLTVPRELQRNGEWIELGTAHGSGAVTLTRPKRSLRPGDAQPDIVGPLVAVADAEPVLVRGTQLRQACGAPADWIDVIAR